MHVQASTRLTFGEHLSELRFRAFMVALSVLAGSCAGYALRDTLLRLLLAPLRQSVYYTTPAGGFSLAIQISLFFGLIVSLPVLTYHVLRFIHPALPSRLAVDIGLSAGVSFFLMMSGLLFAYAVALPAALAFLSGFDQGGVSALISVDSYFSFVTRYLFGFALIFQIPLLIVNLNRIVRLRFKALMRAQGIMFLISFTLAAVITPTPDPVNQALMALPLVLLYQAAVLWICINNALFPQPISAQPVFPAPSEPTPLPAAPSPQKKKPAMRDIASR